MASLKIQSMFRAKQANKEVADKRKQLKAELLKEKMAAQLERTFVDCGGQVLRRILFSLRDHSGNLIPLQNSNWSAQICFGFPN